MNLRYIMKLRYAKRIDHYVQCYDINCANIAFYRYWDDGLPVGIYKNRLFGLSFRPISKTIENRPLGIKVNYYNYEIEI